MNTDRPRPKWTLNRRTLVLGGIAGAAALAAGGYGAVRLVAQPPHTPEAEAENYPKLLADVHDDYVNGRVVEHQGWVLSQHEYDTIDARSGEPAHPAVSGIG